MEPRWKKIVAFVVMGLEKSIAQTQTQIMGLEIGLENLQAESLKKEDGESNAEFANRVKDRDIKLHTMPRQIASQKAHLAKIVARYEQLCRGEGEFAEKAGQIESIESLFKPQEEEEDGTKEQD